MTTRDWIRNQQRVARLVRKETCVTLRDVARRLNLTQEEVEEFAEEHDSICVNTGIRCGNAIGIYQSRGDYVLEWLD